MSEPAPRPELSVVIPVYLGEGCLHELHRRLVAALEKVTPQFEIILVDDGSPDRSWPLIAELTAKDPRVRALQLSRNFGQHFAITAGLDYCTGRWVVVMDCDLQDQPEEIARLYAKAQEGYEVVFARRVVRQDSLRKRLSSRMFFAVYDYFTESASDSSIASFGIYSSKVVTAFRRMREHTRAFTLFMRWLGFNSTSIDVEHAARHSGSTSYSFSKLLGLAVDAIVAQTNKPLRLFVKLGLLVSIVSFLFGSYEFVRYFFFNMPMGWTSVIVTLFFVGGINIFGLGLVGLYVGKIFDETKNRPLYVVAAAKNLPLDS